MLSETQKKDIEARFDNKFIVLNSGQILLKDDIQNNQVLRPKANIKHIKQFLFDEIERMVGGEREKIHEFAADERDKADKLYKEQDDDYSQGYYMAMNTIMKYLEKYPNNRDIKK